MPCRSPQLLSCTPHARRTWSGGQEHGSRPGPRDGSWWLRTDSLYLAGTMRTAAIYHMLGYMLANVQERLGAI